VLGAPADLPAQQPTLFDQDAVDLRHPALGLYLVKS
jgi:hypothetical protein